MYQFKAKDSEIKPNPLGLGDIAKDFTLDNMKKKQQKKPKKNRITRKCKSFSVDYNAID